MVKPIQYNDIVETIEGVHKQTRKLQRRFTLLTKQIEAKLLQNQQTNKQSPAQAEPAPHQQEHRQIISSRHFLNAGISGQGLLQEQRRVADTLSAGPESGQLHPPIRSLDKQMTANNFMTKANTERSA